MTADEFRHLALGQSHARITSRLGSIEFLVVDKVFATLGAPNPAFAVLRLTPEDQAELMTAAPTVFSPQAGGAGVRGVTCVRLALAQPAHLKPALAKAAAKARNSRGAESDSRTRRAQDPALPFSGTAF